MQTRKYRNRDIVLALLGLALKIALIIMGMSSGFVWGESLAPSSPLLKLIIAIGVGWLATIPEVTFILLLGLGFMAGQYTAKLWPGLDFMVHVFIGLAVTVLGMAAYSVYYSMPRGWFTEVFGDPDTWEGVGTGTKQSKPPEQPAQAKPPAPPAPPVQENPFARLVGVERAVEAIRDALELPIRYPDKVKAYGLKPGRGVLLYGPPGTGKTSLAKAAAKYFNCAFWVVNAAELVGPWVGQSEQALRDIFAQARAKTPSIIFFDEIDAIGQRRDGRHLNRPSDILLNQLLAEMDGFRENDGVFVMAATNRPDVLDEALLRPGRFDQLIEVPLPDKEARKKLFQLYLENKPLAGSFNWEVLAEKTEGRSPADIEAICRQGTIKALKREVAGGPPGITMADLV